MLLITISTFVCISLGMMGAYWLLYKPQSAATERLKRLRGNHRIGIQLRSQLMRDVEVPSWQSA